MRIATWNINSLRLRAPLLERLCDALDPDLICLQETKVPDPLFPDSGALPPGYPYVVRRGMKGYNGVAILSRLPLAEQPGPDWCGRGDCRHLAVAVDVPGGLTVHNFYVPAGGDLPDPEQNPKFRHKLSFVSEAAAYFGEHAPRRTVLVGDLNIAPGEHDVWSHRALRTVVSHTEPEIAGMTAWLATGFVDAARVFTPAEQKLFTWWSYRNRDWRKSDRGRRLDHAWISADLQGALGNCRVLKDARDWPRGSDHVPVLLELDG